MKEELLGQVVGAALTAALIVFFVARKQTRGVVPYLAAIGAALAGVGGVFAVNAVTHSLGSSDANIHTFEASFTKGCMHSCTSTGAPESRCQPLCACVLGRLHARYPSNEQFAHWFRSSDTKSEGLQKEMVELSTSCVQAAH